MSAEDKQLLDSLQPFDAHKLRKLLSENVDFSQETLNQALLASCHQGHKFLVQRLVGAGANIEHRDVEGNTPLLICASKGFSDIICFLLARKADVKTVNSDGDNALILSITHSDIDLIQLLLEHKDIDLDLCNNQGYTAIMKAVKVKDIVIIKVLLEKYFCKTKKSEFCSGKKINLSNRGESLEEFAAKSGLSNVIYYLQEYIVKNTCPLKLAIDANDSQSLSVMLNCDFMSEDKFERSVNEAFKHLFATNFQELGQNTNVGIGLIEELLKCGADVNLPILPKINNKPKMSHSISEIRTEWQTIIMRASYSHCKSFALIEAAKHGYLDVVKLLVQYKAEVNMLHNRKINAVDVAFTHGHLSCTDFLVQHGAKINIEEALTFAVEEQNLIFVQFLERVCPPDFKTCIVKFANKLLRLAAREGDLDIIDVLIFNGADINVCDRNTLLPIVESKDENVAEHLIQKGADIKLAKKSKYGQMPALSQILHENVDLDSAREEVIEVLLKHGASVNKTSDCHDDAPIILAARMKNGVKIIQLLLKYGADISGCDNRGKTVLMVAIEDCRSQTLQFLLETFKSSDFINYQDCRGMTALMYAVRDNHISTAAELLENGANVNLRDHEGNIALLYAINSYCELNCEKEMVELLIKFGSNLNDQNIEGHSPLMLACKQGWMNVVQVLVDAGADVNAVNHIRKDHTAITYLTESVNTNPDKRLCLEYLLDHGAHSSFACQTYLRKDIIRGNLITIIPKLIQAGLGPIIPQSVKLRVNFKLIQCQSPFSIALAAGNVQLARFFFGNMFLTQTDVSLLLSNRSKIDISKKYTQNCQKFLDEVPCQPLSLLFLSFVTVTAAVGGSAGRETRIEALPLPRMMKNKLLFKDQAVSLESEPGGVTTATNIYYEESMYAGDIDHWNTDHDSSDEFFDDYSDYYVSSNSNSFSESNSD